MRESIHIIRIVKYFSSNFKRERKKKRYWYHYDVCHTTSII